LDRCGIGVEQLAGAEGLEVAQGTFVENAVGVRLRSGGAGTTIRRSQFHGHTEAALWAVGPAAVPPVEAGGLTVSDSRFENNRLGLVVGNLTATIHDNDIVGSKVAGVYLAGRGVTLHRNRVRAGAGVGVLAALTEGAVITGNEIDHNQAVGIVVSSGRNTIVQDNRIYQNGYGIAVVFGATRSPNRVTANSVLAHSLDGLFVVGASPILEENRAMNNRAAGLRILDFMPRGGAALPANPLLTRNTLEGNGVDEPVHGVFRDPR
jgi:parallel beta-helix repeat protein